MGRDVEFLKSKKINNYCNIIKYKTQLTYQDSSNRGQIEYN
jgi:hypothetical protein